MQENWWSHNTDKLLLYSLVILGGLFMLHILHHGQPDNQLLTWLENAFSTVLGALILILTGRIQRADVTPGGENAPAKTNGNSTSTPAGSTS